MSYRTVEQPSGRGRIEGEGLTANVSYALAVSEKQVAVGTTDGATIPGLRTVDGRIEFDTPAEQAGTLGKTFTLHLDDGRKLKVIVTGEDQIKGTGPFF